MKSSGEIDFEILMPLQPVKRSNNAG